MLLKLVSQRIEGTIKSLFVYRTSFLMSVFSFLFIPYIGCKMLSAQNVWALKGVFEWRTSLECVFITNLYIRVIFHQPFPFSQSFYLQLYIFKPKITFPPSIKGFQSLKGVSKYLINPLNLLHTFPSFQQSFPLI